MIIDQLPSITLPVEDTDEMPIERGQYTYKINLADLLNSASADITVIAAEYDDTASYAVGDYCTYDGLFYRCITAVTAEAWDATKWDEVTVGEELQDKASTSDLATLQTTVGGITPHKASLTIAYASWSGSDPYTQTITISGATITSNTKVDIQADSTALTQLVSDGVTAMFIENNNGTLTLYAIGAATTANITVQVTYYETV